MFNTEQSEKKPPKYSSAFHILLSLPMFPCYSFLMTCERKNCLATSSFPRLVSIYNDTNRLNDIHCHWELVIKKGFSFFANLCTVDLVHKNQQQMRKIHWHLNTECYISSQESATAFKQNHLKSPKCPVLCQHHADPPETKTSWTGKTFQMLFPQNSSKTLDVFKMSIKFAMFAWHPVMFGKRKDSTFLTVDVVFSQSSLGHRNKLQTEFRNCVASTIQHQPGWRNARDLTFYWAIITDNCFNCWLKVQSSHTSTNAQPVPILPHCNASTFPATIV